MKRLINVLALTLAINFLAVCGGVAYLFQSGRLDKDKAMAIKELVFAGPATAPTTKPAAASTQPRVRLDDLLAKHAGLPVVEQVEFIRQSVEAQGAILDRRARELDYQKQQIDAFKGQLAREREAFEAERKAFEARTDEAARLAADKGFQDTMDRYNALPPKQVKTLFATLDDATVVQYFQAMEPRQAGKVMKEFKSAEDSDRLKRIMEKMRQPKLAEVKE